MIGKNDKELDSEKIAERIIEQAHNEYVAKFANVEQPLLHQYERAVMLQAIDSHWREHLASLDYLRQGIHLRGYAQKQPKQEYKREAFELFGGMLDSIKRQVTQILVNVRVETQEQVEAAEKAAEEALATAAKNVQYTHADFNEAAEAGANTAGVAIEAQASAPFVREGVKIGRNDPCWCGSGKKYKQCHGKLS